MIPAHGKDCVTREQAEAYFVQVFIGPFVEDLFDRLVQNRLRPAELVTLRSLGWAVHLPSPRPVLQNSQTR